MPGIDLRNIGSIFPNGTGTVTVSHELNVTGDVDLLGTPAPVYRINGVPIGTPAGSAGQIQFNANTTTPPAFGASANLFWDNVNSRLGIGTPNPVYELDVNGVIAIGGAYCFYRDASGFLQVRNGPNFNSVITFDNSGALYGVNDPTNGSSPQALVLRAANLGGLTSRIIINTNNTVEVWTGDAPRVLIDSAGVGIGTQAPQAALDVAGGIRADLPTSSAGLPTGALWNNAGVVNVA